MRRIAVVLVVALVAALPAAAAPRQLRVLFLGNSLTAANDLPATVAAIGRAGGVAVDYRTIAPGGVSLEDHWAIPESRATVAAGGWDAVVLQQGPSALPESRANLREWAVRWADEIRAHAARPALYAVWPERYRRWAFGAVATSYREAAAAADAAYLPAGDAWRAAWRRNSRLKLYSPDGFHPDPLGTYLAAAVVYGGLTGALPATLPTKLPGIRITPKTARTLRAAAAEALARR